MPFLYLYMIISRYNRGWGGSQRNAIDYIIVFLYFYARSTTTISARQFVRANGSCMGVRWRTIKCRIVSCTDFGHGLSIKPYGRSSTARSPECCVQESHCRKETHSAISNGGFAMTFSQRKSISRYCIRSAAASE